MSTTFDSALNDNIIIDEALNAYTATLAPLGMFSTKYSQHAEKRGSSITVPLIGSMEATEEEGEYETPSGSAGAVKVSLDKYAKATVGLTDREFAESSVADLKTFGKQMGAAVAVKVIKNVFSLITKSNYPTSLTPEAGMSMMDLLTLARAKFNSLMVPMEGRSYFPSSDAFLELAKDPVIKVASAMTYGGTEYIRDGVIPRLLGFDLFESTILPTSPAAVNGFVAHPSAIAIATRAIPPSEQRAYIETRKITDPATGITMTYRRHYGTGKGKQFATIECYYGYAVGIKEGLIMLPSIPTAAGS